MKEDKPALVVHGHFYQPPRENPWTEKIDRQSSAHPYHDWNERIYSECYRPNAYARISDGGGRIESIVNSYEHLSFNFRYSPPKSLPFPSSGVSAVICARGSCDFPATGRTSSFLAVEEQKTRRESFSTPGKVVHCHAAEAECVTPFPRSAW